MDDIYETIRAGKFCIMPNHIHGIIFIEQGGHDGGTGGQSRPPLHKVLQEYKSVTTRMCFQMGCQKIWQRSYHDHIIRNEAEYQHIWRYIDENPARWEEDVYFKK